MRHLKNRLRADVIRRLEMASREDPIINPEAAAYVAIVQVAVEYFEALTFARKYPTSESAQMLIRAELMLRAVIGWPDTTEKEESDD